MKKHPPVITRFAPSPTGNLHIGGARSALFCWAFARKHGGHFVLRIEDTDAARSSDASAQGIMEDLAWLGIEWDEGPELKTAGKTIGGDPRGVGPFFQARRLALYNEHIMRLVEQGKAYPAIESEEELAAEKKRAGDAKVNYRYSRASLAKIPDIKDRVRLIERGEPHVIRLHTAHEAIDFTDQVLGDVHIEPGEVDDFILRRRDGFPMYNFAVVVDDHTMGVTHVLRAQEHLSNTPRQIALYRAFGYTPPSFGHMPLIFNMDGTKMSKRDKAKFARRALKDAMSKGGGGANAPSALAAQLKVDEQALSGFLSGDNDSLEVAGAIAQHFQIGLPEIQVSDFREAGYQPGAICNFLALLGWNPGMKTPDGKDLEKFDKAFLAQHFGVERIGRTNAKFDRAKLLSFNGDAISAMSESEFAEKFLAWCREFEPKLVGAMRPAGSSSSSTDADFHAQPHPRWLWLCRAIKQRAKTMRDGAKAASFALLTDDGYAFDQAAVAKHLQDKGGAGLAMLRDVHDRLSTLSEFEPQMVHVLLEQLAQQSGAGMGGVAQPIRVAVTGSTVSPPLGETLAVIGKEHVLRRIERCVKAVSV